MRNFLSDNERTLISTIALSISIIAFLGSLDAHCQTVTVGPGNRQAVYQGSNPENAVAELSICKDIPTCNSMLRAARGMRDIAGQAGILLDLAELQRRRKNYAEELSALEQVLAIKSNGDLLQTAAVASFKAAKPDEGVAFLLKAADRYSDEADFDSAAQALDDAGRYYGAGTGQRKQQAITYLRRAIDLYGKAEDPLNQAESSRYLAAIYESTGDLALAAQRANASLAFYTGVSDGDEVARTQELLAMIDLDLGQRADAKELMQEVVTHWQGLAAGLRKSAAHTNNLSKQLAGSLNDLGLIYASIGDNAAAFSMFSSALQLAQRTRDSGSQARIKANCGRIYLSTGKPDRAIVLLQTALLLWKSSRDNNGKATALIDLGTAYTAKGQLRLARQALNQALPLALLAGDPLVEAELFQRLMALERISHPQLAIAVGKLGINLIQRVKGQLRGLGEGARRGFTESYSDYYRQLADLLISVGRLPEAEQVVDLMKQQEFYEFTRGKISKEDASLALTPAEKKTSDGFANIETQVISIGDQYLELANLTDRTPEQEIKFNQVAQKILVANTRISNYLTNLYIVFKQGSLANSEVANLEDRSRTLQEALISMPRTVALYTIVSKDRLRILVITGGAMVAREVPITAIELNKKVFAFRQALNDPAKDPRPTARDLYKVLIGPIESDLDQAHAHTLVFSLDGVLRYIPVAALHDQQHYLVEKYAIASFTTASLHFLSVTPNLSHLNAAAFGISRHYQDNLTDLPEVEQELDGIVHDESVAAKDGVMPGTISLNNDFTELSFIGHLEKKPSVVHVASHFLLGTSDTDSYLLLAGESVAGSGYHLTVAKFRDDPRFLMDRTLLLTLSACETGVTTFANNGREINSLATSAHLQHVQSVLSSLWAVNDESTGQFMVDFYGRWVKAGGTTSKAEALRQVQLDFLTGSNGVVGSGSARAINAEYAHPYYWAPFVITGNWL